MCGIAGIYNFQRQEPVARQAVRRMCQVIQHRGPDAEGLYPSTDTASPIGLGMRRLAIINLSTGDQPIHNEDSSLWIVLNGEIYNYRELRAALEPRHQFSTQSDTEVIVHLYEEYGESCVDHLRGMFAFAIWDSRNQRLFLAKDRIGKKPLYYTVTNGTLLFGSEIKAILAGQQSTPPVNREAVDLYLSYQYIPSPTTIFTGIYSLLPAHTVTCDRHGLAAPRRYWDLDYTRKTTLSFPEACERTRELLTEATRIRMVADVPLGAFLSGGHDSTIIVGIMSQLSSSPVKTYTIGFAEEEYSELKFASIAARHFATDHHQFILKPDFIDLLPKIAWHYGQPFADSSALPSYLVAHETRKHVTVALNGDGGDEAFGGYLRYKAMQASEYLSLPFRLMGQKNAATIANMIATLNPLQRNRLLRYLRRFFLEVANPPAERNLAWYSMFNRPLKKALYSDEFSAALSQDAFNYMKDLFMTAPAATVMDRTYYTDMHAYLPECLLVKMDIASMANSLEARSPLLDHKVLEFSASLPSSWKVHGLTTKYIMRRAFDRMLPPEILRRGKMGFGIPLAAWFRNQWKDYFIDTVLSPQAVQRGYFKKSALESLLQDHLSGKCDHGYRLWTLLMLELWHREYTDRSSYRP